MRRSEKGGKQAGRMVVFCSEKKKKKKSNTEARMRRARYKSEEGNRE